MLGLALWVDSFANINGNATIAAARLVEDKIRHSSTSEALRIFRSTECQKEIETATKWKNAVLPDASNTKTPPK